MVKTATKQETHLDQSDSEEYDFDEPDREGFTRYPNFLIDHALPHLSPSEASVLSVIVFKTIGWNRTWDRISLSQFEEMSGLSRPTVIEAIGSLLKKNIIERRKESDSYIYRVCRASEWLIEFPGKATFSEITVEQNESF